MELEGMSKIIMDTINMLTGTLFTSLEDSIFPLLDKIVFLAKDFNTSTIDINKFEKSMLILSNSLLLLVAIIYITKAIFAHHMGIEYESPYKFFIRAVVFGIVMNSSFFVCSLFIEIVNYITEYVRAVGSLQSGKLSFASLRDIINSITTQEVVSNEPTFNLFSIDGIIKGLISFGSITLVLTYTLRFVMLKVLILISPLAFMSLISSATEGFFKSWYKSFLALLMLQILVAFILIIPFSIGDGMKKLDDMFLKLLIAGSIYALYKANDFIREFMGGIGIGANFQSGISGVRNLLSR